ncbi:VWA domain-containing protein [Paracoccus laeviglucosivorans]|uniref:Ca-activated chloride channel family protein n=1 Tax=Paracoccus laeviglucosivorans TaxID=1197861 RepID=A0A521B813_9RHOB|nr:VWA domain-containing protein [Paracoccus laeviglucosivorans]SMO43237.1 Ca-activated chloride channel family protein [Paracoccus laeviglucosivorans]
MGFAFPLALLLLPLPLLMRLLPPAAAKGGLVVPPQVFGGTVGSAGRGGWVIPALAWGLLVLALAGPQVDRQSALLPASGRDIVLAIDLSGSMEKQDFSLDGQPISRLDAVKRVAGAFVAARKGDRIGLVVFGDRAYFAQPVTFDVAAVARAIDEAQIGISGRATAISDGLGLAMRRLVNSDAPTRVVVLLSDGVPTSGKVGAVDAARLAATHGIRVHTIALGPADLENQPKTRDAVDAKMLREVAEASGGTSFRVRGMADLQGMAATLDALEPNPGDRPPLRFWQSLWVWPAVLALALLALMGWRRG